MIYDVKKRGDMMLPLFYLSFLYFFMTKARIVKTAVRTISVRLIVSIDWLVFIIKKTKPTATRRMTTVVRRK